MKVTYLTHSCFFVELANCCLLFDYFKGQFPDIPKGKTLYVFASHKHQDHYNSDIFKLSSLAENVIYILSKDIRLTDSYLDRFQIPVKIKDNSITAEKNSIFSIQDLVVETLTSTDEGVAYLVYVEGITIYHGGDLNWWHWEEESKAWNRDMEARYTREINKIKGREIDLAFVPVDPRLKDSFHLGIQYYLRNTETKTVFPMHMWGEYSVIKKLKERDDMIAYRNHIMELTKEGEVFSLV